MKKASAARQASELAQRMHKRYKRFCAVALRFPGVEQSMSYGTPSLKVGGKLLARWRTEADGSLALRCDILDRQILLQAVPRAFFVTDHYFHYPIILVRLEWLRRAELHACIERAWRTVASRRLISQYERGMIKARQGQRRSPRSRRAKASAPSGPPKSEALKRG
jgi:hypothetical protein